MNRKIWAAVGGAAILAATALPAFAAESTVSATVTPTLVALSVVDGTVAYGVLTLSPNSGSPVTKSTVDLGQTQVITNDGNVNEDYAVKSSDATGGSTPWNLVAAASISTDAYDHQYSTNGTTYTDFPSANGYTSDIITNQAPTANANLDTKILMPTASTDVDTQKTITVTILATET